MRSVMGGLLGLCLLAGLVPADANARTDPRGSAQVASSSSRAPVARPAVPRAPSARIATAPRQAAMPASMGSSRATSSRQAVRQSSSRGMSLVSRPITSSRPASGGPSPGNFLAARGASMRHATAVPYSRQAAAAQPLRQTAMATCTTRNGRRTCGSPTRSASLPWMGGLTPAAMSQAGCPDGTIATNALGHSDIVRCVPL